MSFTFRDRLGRTWDTSLTLASAKRIDASNFDSVTKLRDFSFLQPDKKLFTEIVSNAGFMVALIWAVVYPQATKQIGDDALNDMEKAELEFADGFDGATLDAAREKFMSAMSDFFREHATVLSTLNRQRNAAIAKLDEQLKGIDKAATEFIESEVEAEIGPLREALASGDREKVKALLKKD